MRRKFDLQVELNLGSVTEPGGELILGRGFRVVFSCSTFIWRIFWTDHWPLTTQKPMQYDMRPQRPRWWVETTRIVLQLPPLSRDSEHSGGPRWPEP